MGSSQQQICIGCFYERADTWGDPLMVSFMRKTVESVSWLNWRYGGGPRGSGQEDDGFVIKSVGWFADIEALQNLARDYDQRLDDPDTAGMLRAAAKVIERDK